MDFVMSPALAAQYGRRVLLVTGARSFPQSSHWPAFAESLRASGAEWETFTIAGEPLPQLVDDAAERFRKTNPVVLTDEEVAETLAVRL